MEELKDFKQWKRARAWRKFGRVVGLGVAVVAVAAFLWGFLVVYFAAFGQ